VSDLLVVDASAVLALLIDSGERGEAAAVHMSRAALAAPDLLGYEVLNVLRRRRAAGHLSEGEARLAVDSWGRLPIDLWPLEAVAARVWELAGGLSAYDAAYVAVAERVGAPLLTGDRRLAGAPGVLARIITI